MLTCFSKTSQDSKLRFAPSLQENQRENQLEGKTQAKNYQIISTAWLKKKKFILETRLTLQ
jgi:hypothetical protein